MGCFAVLKGKKKKTDQSVHIKRVLPQESASTTLPEPQIRNNALQSAPPSFRTRGQPVQPANNLTISSRMRALSAPSSLHGRDRELSPTDYEEKEDLKSLAMFQQEQRSPTPQPLPLPSPHVSGSLKSTGSFKLRNSSGPLCASGPLPLPPSGGLRQFTDEEITSACLASETCTSESLSSTNFMASFLDVSCSARKIEATVTRFYPSAQGSREFMNEVNTIASLQHPNLCKLLGYHSPEGSDHRILVYERLHHGSLDRLLYGRSIGPPVDWNARVKVALCAAQGLTFLHEQGPFQAMYNEFSTVNIQIDKDFSAKLSGYGCVGLLPEADISNNSSALGNLSVETVEKGLLTPKSNVYSFGIVLLELLTGKKNMDNRKSKEERNLVKSSWPFLADECRLSLIMDPQLKGRFPIKAARTVADIAQKCLQKDPAERPTMRTVVESLKTIQDVKYSCRFPLQEPGTVSGKQMFRSPSLPPRQSYSHPSPSRVQASPVSPTRPLSTLPLSLPPRSCSSVLSFVEMERQEARKSSSSAVFRRSSVEGF